jgi:two-component system, cell cycle sensor histidine kinase and response regulator CckA
MSWTSLVGAIPIALWLPMAAAVLAPVLVAVLVYWPRTRTTVARRVAATVALQLSLGLTVLVLTTAVAVFRAGLSQLSSPTPTALAALATDVERVLRTTEGDEPSVIRRLSLIDAGDQRVAWSMVGALACSSADCRVIPSPGLTAREAAAVNARALTRSGSAAWPVDIAGRVAMVVPVPLRDALGTPDARLLIGLDATSVVRQAQLATWGMLGVTVALWLLVAVGTRRAVTLSVSERLRQLTNSLDELPASTVPPALVRSVEPRAARDELQALTQAVERAGERSVREQLQFRTLFDHAPVGIARLDERGAVLAANPRFRALLRLGAGDDVPAWTAIFRDEAELAALTNVLHEDGALSGASWRWHDGIGGTRVVRASVVSLPTSAGALGAVLLVEDVTEQRALEAQLLRTQKMDVVGQLAGGIAHDFNNLLTVVRANVAALEMGTAQPELGAIDDAAARGARLVRRLLAISRRDALSVSTQPIGPLLFETVSMVRRVLPARIRVEAPAEVPASTVLLDADAVEQALLNLALNAADAIEGEGTIRINARELPADREQRMLVVSVSDTGTGMTADVLARATEPFFTTKPVNEGTGLGLSTVHSIMTQLGGRLEIESTPGQGTHVELWFPVVSSHDAVAAPPATETPPTTVDVGTPVLLVEDEDAVREATARILQRLGCFVTSVSNITDAYRVIETDPSLALVVSDVMMPGGTGLDLLRRVRGDGRTIPFLIVTGYSVESLEGAVSRDPRLSVLTKPWTIDELRERVHAMLSSTRPTRASSDTTEPHTD